MIQPTEQHCQEGSERKKQMVSYCSHIHIMKSSDQFQTLQLEYPLFHTPTLSPTKEEMFTRRPMLGSASTNKETLEHIVEEDDACVQKILEKNILRGLFPVCDGIPFKLAAGSNVPTVLLTKEIFDQNLLYCGDGNVFVRIFFNDSLQKPFISNQNGVVSAAAQAAGSNAAAGDGIHSNDLMFLNPTKHNKTKYAQNMYYGRNKQLRYYSCNNFVSCWLPLFFILCCGISMAESVDPLLNISELKSAINTYQDAATIGKYGPIENWDVSRVTSLMEAFKDKGTFNADLSKWNVSSVTTMDRSKCSHLKCSPRFFHRIFFSFVSSYYNKSNF
jgi:hypothetical protein